MNLNYKQNNWVELLPIVTFNINNSPSEALPSNRTPIEVETATSPLLPMDTHKLMRRNIEKSKPSIEDRMTEITSTHEQVREALSTTRDRMRQEQDKNRRTVSSGIVVGSKVWLNLAGINLSRFSLRPCPKLNPRYFGPFEVLAQPGRLRYKLKLPDDYYIHDTVHVDRLKPYTHPSMVKYKGKNI
eukprot:SAG31_NODE_13878_length_840_cov_1.217274_1_plen_185_part_01